MTRAARLVLAALLVVWCALLVLILAACGGGGSGTPDVKQPEQVGSAPVPPAPAQRPWIELAREDWADPIIAGWSRADARPCQRGSLDDPGSEPRRDFRPGDLVAVNGPRGAAMAPGRLLIDDTQTGAGWALLTGATYPVDRPLAAQAVVDLQPDLGAWIGLAIHNGDGNYREIGLGSLDGATLRAVVHAPCYVEWLGAVPPGPHDLRIEYDPAAGWRMLVGGALVYSEPIDYRGNRLLAAAPIGLWVVNLAAEAQRGTTGLVRAAVGPITVEGGR